MKQLFDYLSIPGLSKSSRRVVMASIYAAIFGRQYNVDGVGLDLCALVADDARLVRSYIDGITLVLPKFGELFPAVAEVSPVILAKTAANVGSFAYLSDINMVKAQAKSMSRRAGLTAMYKSSGESLVHYVRLEDGARKAFEVVSPAVSSIVLDSYDAIATTLRKQKDEFFGRYIYALERIPNAIVSHENFKVALEIYSPAYEHLRIAMDVAKTLRDADKVVEVGWSLQARGHFDETLEARWEGGETSSEMCVHTYKKIKKLSALFALARSYHDPVIQTRDIDEAVAYLDIERAMLDTKTEALELREQRKVDFVRKLRENLDSDYIDNVSRNSKPFLHELGMVTSAHMLIVCSGLKSFAGDPALTKKQALNQVIRDLVKDGVLEVLPDTHRLATGGDGEDGKGRIFSDILYMKGYHEDRIHEWK